jgi:electron transport complex protein RnfD
MLDVIIALSAPLLASVMIFGFYPLFLTLLSVGTAVLTEFLICKIRNKENTVGDLSAVVTGMILGLCLPPVVPFYVPVVGAVFAIGAVKMLFGGLGRNFANPAATARIFLMLSWTGLMTAYAVPIDLNAGAGALFGYFKYGAALDISAVTTATPLASYAAAPRDLNLLDLFLGKIGGSAGEVSALAVLIGGVYLGARRVIDIKIPLIYIGTTALFTLLFYGSVGYVLPGILSGGLLFGAVYMATDYSTSPDTFLGTAIYAVGLGLLTTLIRRFGTLPEGVSLAILLMNVVTPLLDKYIHPKPFGYVKPVKVKRDKNAENV